PAPCTLSLHDALPISQRAALTIVAFIGTFIVALSFGRFLKRRAEVRLGILYQLFCLALAFYVALAVYGLEAPWRVHVGAAAILLDRKSQRLNSSHPIK